jgi:hypothetical protein
MWYLEELENTLQQIEPPQARGNGEWEGEVWLTTLGATRGRTGRKTVNLVGYGLYNQGP